MPPPHALVPGRGRVFARLWGMADPEGKWADGGAVPDGLGHMEHWVTTPRFARRDTPRRGASRRYEEVRGCHS